MNEILAWFRELFHSSDKFSILDPGRCPGLGVTNAFGITLISSNGRGTPTYSIPNVTLVVFNLVLFQKLAELILKSRPSMVLFLVHYVTPHLRNV